MSVKVRRKLKAGMIVWVEWDTHLSSRGWVPARCYRGEITRVGKAHEQSKWRSIEIVEENGTWHRTFTDHLKVVKIEDDHQASREHQVAQGRVLKRRGSRLG